MLRLHNTAIQNSLHYLFIPGSLHYFYLPSLLSRSECNQHCVIALSSYFIYCYYRIVSGCNDTQVFSTFSHCIGESKHLLMKCFNESDRFTISLFLDYWCVVISVGHHLGLEISALQYFLSTLFTCSMTTAINSLTRSVRKRWSRNRNS